MDDWSLVPTWSAKPVPFPLQCKQNICVMSMYGNDDILISIGNHAVRIYCKVGETPSPTLSIVIVLTVLVSVI